MKRNLVVVMGALVASAMTVQGQSSQCKSSVAPQQNACNMGVDLFNYMAPQLGAVIAGGNTTLGQGGTAGGFPRFAISLRANALAGSLPQLRSYSPFYSPNPLSNTSAQTVATKNQVLAMPVLDASIGVFPGLSLGVTRVGGIDALVNVSYIPEYNGGGVTVKTPNGSTKFGYGVRVGVLQEGLLTPGIGVSYVKRDLPTVDIHATAGQNSIDVNALDAKTASWRVTASKSFLLYGLAVGGGQDKYESSASISGVAPPYVPARANVSQSLTRTNYFADVYMNVMLAKLVAEIGTSSGGSVPTYNTFSGKAADASRLYGSLGLRIGF